MPSTLEMPPRIAKLATNDAGYPVPWFVAWIDGEPDFRIIGLNKIEIAVKESRCWICGGLLFGMGAFTIGPMCAVNRVSAEPPSHWACAEYAARACPFLTNPKKRRREGGIEESVSPGGIAIKRNPGVALVWLSGDWSIFSDGAGGSLFNVGTPRTVAWFAEGRDATRDEVLASIDSGLPLLREMAEQDGADAVEELERLTGQAMALVPA